MSAARIAELKARLEAEICMLKVQLADLNVEIREAELGSDGQFATMLRAQRSETVDRLTSCGVTYDECWPNEQYVLKHLEDFYTELPLH